MLRSRERRDTTPSSPTVPLEHSPEMTTPLTARLRLRRNEPPRVSLAPTEMPGRRPKRPFADLVQDEAGDRSAAGLKRPSASRLWVLCVTSTTMMNQAC